MAKVIIFNFYNRKLLLPFGIALFQILINILNVVVKESMKNQFLEMMSQALSEMAIALIPLLNIYSFKSGAIVFFQRKKRKTPLHFFILCVIFTVYIGLTILKSIDSAKYIKNNQALNNPHNGELSSFESLELIFICIVSVLLLKYKYFKHHNIAIIIFVLISLGIDLILDKFTELFERGPLFIILSLVLVVLDSIDYGYQKYMMDVLFHPYWSIPITIGIINFVIFGTLIVVCLKTGKEDSFESGNMMFISFYKYFEEVSVATIVVKHILGLILNFGLNLLRTLTILYFTPDFILISFTISRIINIVMDTERYECLALFVLQFITLMFYLEIFELNFWGLNENTRRNILQRERQESILQEKLENDSMSGRSSNASEIEITPDYVMYDRGRNSPKDISSPKYEVMECIELNEKYDDE